MVGVDGFNGIGNFPPDWGFAKGFVIAPRVALWQGGPVFQGFGDDDLAVEEDEGAHSLSSVSNLKSEWNSGSNSSMKAQVAPDLES